jgi:hypothetical protein
MATLHRRPLAHTIVVGTGVLVALGSALTTAAPSGAGTVTPSVSNTLAAYVWAGQPTATSYTPASEYSFNSSGAPNTIERYARGRYIVHFPGVASDSNAGTVAATAYGFRSHQAACKVEGFFDVTGGGIDTYVDCYSPTGEHVDARFSAAYAVPEATNIAYAWYDAPVADTYTVDAFNSYNGWGGTITGHHLATGSYQVTIANAAETANLGTVKVTSVGLGNVECWAYSWIQTGSDVSITVNCSNPDGTPANGRFEVIFADRTNLVGRSDLHTGYAWVNDSSSPRSTPSTLYQFQRPGGTIKVVHSSVGKYVLTLPRQAATGGNVQVMPYQTSLDCSAFRWVAVGTSEQVQVRCFDSSGTAQDAQFVVQWMATT